MKESMDYGMSISSVSADASSTVIRLCTETPTAGGRVFETGDEKLLQFAHKNQGTFPTSSCYSFNRLVINQFPLWLCSLNMTD